MLGQQLTIKSVMFWQLQVTKHLAVHWSLYNETPLSQTWLILELVPTAIVLK